MINGLTEYEKYKVIRPIIGDCKYDKNDMPIIERTNTENFVWEDIEVVNFKNMKNSPNNQSKILTMFSYDKELTRFWNNPLKKIPVMQTYAAVATPDFSFYPTMNTNEIRHNVYMSRWLGRTWQNYGVNVLPTIGWALPNTYDLCLGAVEKGSVVVISTLGCEQYQDAFLQGFEEMKRRIEPPIIIVLGNMINGMTGTFLNFKYTDTFNNKFIQLKMKELSEPFTIKEVS
ncbi:MAG: DUF4417 domain-containing protein [Eubacteriales bacterium]|nr:DUF4417 domain-containing protein [Eubacteriales bacterium]